MDLVDRYRILGQNVSLRFPSQAMADAFRHMFGGFPAAADSPPSDSYQVEAVTGTDEYRVAHNGRHALACRSLEHLVAQLERTVLRHVYQRMPYLGLHAGAVVRDGQTILFPGTQDSGKSSLTLGLALQGWTLLSDEAAPLDPETSRVVPFARSLFIDSAWLEQFHPYDRQSLLVRPGTVLPIGETCCISPNLFDLAPPDRSLAVDLIVFPTRAPGTRGELVEVSRANALGRLLDHAFNRKAFSGRELAILGKMVDRASCFELRSSTLSRALELVSTACREGNR